jgi:hypothetical protein
MAWCLFKAQGRLYLYHVILQMVLMTQLTVVLHATTFAASACAARDDQGLAVRRLVLKV